MGSKDEHKAFKLKTEDQLIREYTPLVKRIGHNVLSHLPRFIQADDIIQAGMIGLLEASKNYDANKGAAFKTYASFRIRGAMLDEVRKNDWLPRSVYRNARLIADATKVVENRKGCDAKNAEVAAELGMGLMEYCRLIRDTQTNQICSVEDVSVNEFKLNNHYQEPLNNVQREDFYKLLAQAIRNLPKRDRMIMSFYYDRNLNLKEIGARLGITESRVCQIRNQAMLKIQSSLPFNSKSE